MNLRTRITKDTDWFVLRCATSIRQNVRVAIRSDTDYSAIGKRGQAGGPGNAFRSDADRSAIGKREVWPGQFGPYSAALEPILSRSAFVLSVVPLLASAALRAEVFPAKLAPRRSDVTEREARLGVPRLAVFRPPVAVGDSMV